MSRTRSATPIGHMSPAVWRPPLRKARSNRGVVPRIVVGPNAREDEAMAFGQSIRRRPELGCIAQAIEHVADGCHGAEAQANNGEHTLSLRSRWMVLDHLRKRYRRCLLECNLKGSWV